MQQTKNNFAFKRFCILFFVFVVWMVNTHLLQAQVIPYRYVKVENRQLLVDFDRNGEYVPYFIKGVGYHPSPIGRHPSDWGYTSGNPRVANILDDPQILDRDFTLLKAMNINTIRLWKGDNTLQSSGQFPDKMTSQTLDKAEFYGIKVIAGFWVEPGLDFADPLVRNDLKTRFQIFVNAFKDHTAILFWAIGNENNLYLDVTDPTQFQEWYSLVNEMAGLAHSAEGSSYHPVAVVNGDILLDDDLDPATDSVVMIGSATYGTRDLEDLPNLDIWGVNVYRGNSFGNLFSSYSAKSTKPLWFSEFNIDAWHTVPTGSVEPPMRNFCVEYPWSEVSASGGCEDEIAQAEYANYLWEEIIANRSISVGGTMTSYADEWWKPYEWLCEEEIEADCHTLINAPRVTFRWEPRPLASNYQLLVGTTAWTENVANVSVGNVTSFEIINIPFTGKDFLYVRLLYTVQGQQLTEFYQYPMSLEQKNPTGNIKISPFASWRNHFSLDWDAPFPDGLSNEEWWGVVSISKNPTDPFGIDQMHPRLVYYDLQQIFSRVYQRPVVNISTVLPEYHPGQTVSIDVTATDPGNDPIILTAAMANGDPISIIGASFVDNHNGQRVFSWTPTFESGGQIFSIKFKATDSEGLSAEKMVLIIVVAYRPDLTITQLSLDRDVIYDNAKVFLKATVKNQGDADVGAHRLSFYIDGQEIVKMRRTIKILSKGQTQDFFSSIPWLTTVGNHQIKAVIDSGNIITESNEDNNALTKSMTFKAAPARVVSPASISLINTPTVAFEWSKATGATQYFLHMGTSQGATNIYSGSQGLNTQVTISNIPLIGQPIYVRLWSQIGGKWQYSDQTYQTAAVNTLGVLRNSSVYDSTEIFEWSPGVGAMAYQLWIGRTTGAMDIYKSPDLTGTSVTVSNIPTGPSYFYVRLWSKIGNTWFFKDYRLKNKI